MKNLITCIYSVVYSVYGRRTRQELQLHRRIRNQNLEILEFSYFIILLRGSALLSLEHQSFFGRPLDTPDFVAKTIGPRDRNNGPERFQNGKSITNCLVNVWGAAKPNSPSSVHNSVSVQVLVQVARGEIYGQGISTLCSY